MTENNGQILNKQKKLFILGVALYSHVHLDAAVDSGGAVQSVVLFVQFVHSPAR